MYKYNTVLRVAGQQNNVIYSRNPAVLETFPSLQERRCAEFAVTHDHQLRILRDRVRLPEPLDMPIIFIGPSVDNLLGGLADFYCGPEKNVFVWKIHSK